MRQKWEECCHSNLCLGDSCYSVEWRAAAWAAVRDRCRGRYANWPFAVDILRVYEEKDIQLLWSLLSHANAYPNANLDMPITVWTSGTLCPEQGPKGLVVSTRWASKQSFPVWLEEKVKETSKDHNIHKDGCRFLVISPETNKTANYDFQDENATHIAICEFLFPKELSKHSTVDVFATTMVTYNYSAALSPTVTLQENSTPFIAQNNVTSITNNVSESETAYSDFLKDFTTHRTTSNTILSIATGNMTQNASKISFKDILSTVGLFSDTSEELTTSQGIGWSTMHRRATESDEKSTDDSLITKTMARNQSTLWTTAHTLVRCKGIQSEGINWPDAQLGEIVNKSCPEGMLGYALWTCNKETQTFFPTKPDINDCRHEWIDNLKKEIAADSDAVTISSTLADHTKGNVLSHGDIKALVDLSENLVNLFKKQESHLMIGDKRKMPPASYNFTKSMVATFSNVLSSKHVGAWINLPQIHQRHAASTMLRHMTSVGQILSCYQVNTTDDLQFTVTEENIDLQTFMFESNLYAHQFPKTVGEINSTSRIILPADITLDLWPSPCGETKTAVGIIYKKVGNFLSKETREGIHSNVSSVILSFSIGNSSESIHLPKGLTVSVILEHTKKQARNVQCVFWNFSRGLYGQWDNSGCFIADSNETHTECKCSHLTNFAIIMDVNNVIDVHDPISEMMTLVCCGTSIIALLLTLTFLLGVRSMHCRRSTITANLCFCLLIMNLLIIFGFNQTKNHILCAIIAGVVQYIVLSSFCWMLLEGYHLYQKVVSVFSHSSVGYFYAAGYGIPLIIVGISAGLRYKDYGRQDFCWLSIENELRWSIAGPASFIILVNLIIFVLTIQSASSLKIKKEQTRANNLRSWIVGSFSILCLLGLTWCIGLFLMIRQLNGVSYVFITLNGLQGVFIFIFHILLNEKAKTACLRLYKKIKSQSIRKRSLKGTTSISQLRGKSSRVIGVNNSRNTITSGSGSRTNSHLSNMLKPISSGKTVIGIPSPGFCSTTSVGIRSPEQKIISKKYGFDDFKILNSKFRSHDTQCRSNNFFPAIGITSLRLNCVCLKTSKTYDSSKSCYICKKR